MIKNPWYYLCELIQVPVNHFQSIVFILTARFINVKCKKYSISKERHSSKQANILILKTILFISQNMFQSIHTSSSVAKSITKTVNILNLHIS